MKIVWALIASAGLLVALAALVAFIAHRRVRARVREDVAALFSGAGAGVGPDDLKARWDTLPNPVRRHLRYAIREGAPAIRTARLEHDGFFRTKPGQDWFAIQGRQYFTAATPGFVWNACIWPAPFLWIDATDRLLSGRGNMLVKLASAIPLADATGSEIDQGASLRWLAECAWFPYALVGDQIEWTPIDARTARATLRRGGLPVTAVVEVDEEGKLTRLRAERYRDIGGGKAVITPWTGRYHDYREFDHVRVPSSVEVAWELESGPFSYARFRVTALDYNVTG